MLNIHAYVVNLTTSTLLFTTDREKNILKTINNREDAWVGLSKK